MNLTERIGRILLASMFALSVFKNIFLGGFKGSVEYTKVLKFPLPFISTAVALVIKALGAYSLITGYKQKVILPFLIGFLILITILANNPIQNPDKKWMFMALLGVIGGLLIVYNNAL